MNRIQELTTWFACICDGDWEHTSRIVIESLDNPGWSLLVDIYDLYLADREFPPVVIQRSDNDWVHCRIEEGKFLGFCGPENLDELLGIFLEWGRQR